MPAIEVSHLTKEYRLGALQSVKQTLLNAGARLTGRTVEPPPLFKALDDVSFSIEPGEVVGIIGHNGAGKSTLLKMLAGISTPTRGSVKVNGRIAPLIEVGAGFVPDFTGRENVYLNGAILGMSKQEIAKKFDEIVDFAEMAEFIDTPVKRYSSGMQVKLAFAVATSIEAEILIVDEVLAVGDLVFQRKCFDRMEELIKRQGRTVLLVSHNIRQVERLCDRVLLLARGTKINDGPAQQVCTAFYEGTNTQIKSFHSNIIDYANGNESATGDLKIISIQARSQNGDEDGVVTQHDDLVVTIRFVTTRALKALTFGIGLHTSDFVYLVTDHSHLSRCIDELVSGEYVIESRFRAIPFSPGTYGIRVGAADNEGLHTIFYSENLSHIRVIPHATYNQSWQEGVITLDSTWSPPRKYFAHAIMHSLEGGASQT